MELRVLEMEHITPRLQPAKGISAFGNAQTDSGVEEETQICERSAETVPAGRSVGCLSFRVPLHIL